LILNKKLLLASLTFFVQNAQSGSLNPQAVRIRVKVQMFKIQILIAIGSCILIHYLYGRGDMIFLIIKSLKDKLFSSAIKNNVRLQNTKYIN
jgi:hypothetical protein